MCALADFNKLLSEFDQAIVRGEHGKVREQLDALVLPEVPRGSYLTLAGLASRAGTPTLTLRLLGRLLKAGRNAPEPITDSETAEYGMALLQLGASQEALRLLRTVNKIKTPRAFLYEAFALITEWDYASAIPILETYIERDDLSEYQVAVAKLNLAASHLQARNYRDAEGILEKLIEETRQGDYLLLLGNCLEMSAQLSILTGKFNLAEKQLVDAAEFLSGSGSLDHFFVRKWKTLLELHRHGPSDALLAKWQSIRKEALERGHWETVREHDHYLAKFQLDEKLLLKVYFGTPFAAYRKSLLTTFPERIEIPSTYDWAPIGYSGKSVMDLDLGRDLASDVEMKIGSAPHRLLKALASDFYRVSSIGSLFHAIYPGEMFNISTSPLRVHQLIFRLRDWFKKKSVPIEIYEMRNGYRLRFTAPYAIRVSHQTTNIDSAETQILQLVNSFGEVAFSAKEAASQLGVSKRQINKLIEKDNGRSILKIGSGPLTQYKRKPA